MNQIQERISRMQDLQKKIKEEIEKEGFILIMSGLVDPVSNKGSFLFHKMLPLNLTGHFLVSCEPFISGGLAAKDESDKAKKN